MNKPLQEIEKKESNSKDSLSELYLNESSSNEKSKEDSNNIKENNKEEEKEIEINKEAINLSIKTEQEEIMEFETSPIETIPIKKFRNLLGVLGIKANNFIIERLYQTLIRVSSKKYEHTSSNLTDKNFLNFLSILNNNKKRKEIFYIFFDISNKGYVTKKDFITVAENMCLTICEFTQKSGNIYKEKINNYFENILLNEEKDKNQKNINKNSFLNLIEKNKINFFDIMNYDEKIKEKKEINKDILIEINNLINKIKQKEDIETNLSIVTDNYLDNIEIIKEEDDNNSINLSNTSSFIDNNNMNNKNNFGFNQINNIKFDNLINSNINKSFAGSSNQKNENISVIANNTLNTNKTSFLIFPKILSDIKIKSPQERMNINNDDSVEEIMSSNSDSIDDELNYDFLNEEKNDNVNEMDNKNIKNIENIKKNKIKIANNFIAKESLKKKQKKKFLFFETF